MVVGLVPGWGESMVMMVVDRGGGVGGMGFGGHYASTQNFNRSGQKAFSEVVFTIASELGSLLIG